MSRHSFNPGCTCDRCTKEGARRAAQSAANPHPLRRYSAPKAPRKPRRDIASRAEQQGRYIDCGPGAWDDRDSESGNY